MSEGTSPAPADDLEPTPDFVAKWQNYDHDLGLIQDLLALTPMQRLKHHDAFLNNVERLRGNRFRLEPERNPKEFVPPPD